MEYVLLVLVDVISLIALLFFIVTGIIITIYTIRIMRELNIFLKNKNQNNIIKHYE